jgi:GMP synthase PP-ATPase subunit
MTTKRINYDGEEVEHKDLTGEECLKQWVKYSNKYNCKTTVIVYVGEVLMCLDFSKNQVKELLAKGTPMKYRNCETSTRFRLAISGFKWSNARLSIIGSTFQDFEKTKENNWGASQ